MNFQTYATRATVPKRMTRKRARRDTFVANSKMAKARRKERRLFRRELEQGE
jgi:hypothetical protein